MSASKLPSSEQTMSAMKYPNTYRHPTAAEIQQEAAAWKQLSVTAIAAENPSVAEYVKELESRSDAAEKDARRGAWLIDTANEEEVIALLLSRAPQHEIRPAIDIAMGEKK